MNPTERDRRIEEKMRAAGVGRPTIQAFVRAVQKVAAGERGLISEQEVEPVSALPALEEIAAEPSGAGEQLGHLAIIKLNGGLGTSMGLDKAKSLLPVKGPETFLDFIARQVLHLRRGGREPLFYLMNSFVTQNDTLEHLRQYPDLSERGELDFLQNKVPKLDAGTLEPVRWPEHPDLEWCPPGHGDLYPALLGSGLLNRLLARGIQFLFVSNSDNLGATVEPAVLQYFAQSGLSFLMEVAVRTPADRKGGHLARSRTTGRLLLRESAQCPNTDEAAFQDIERHRFFNTNNLWVRLDHLRAELDRQGGILALPLITNLKTVDPKDPHSPKVLQLESAMGAAIECFERTGALVVPRTRFAPVKTTSDLLALRSDAYVVTENWRLALDPARDGQPPMIDLDPKHFKLLSHFDRWLGNVPSLKGCKSLKITGPVQFSPGVVCEGDVEFSNSSAEPKTVGNGQYRDQRVRL